LTSSRQEAKVPSEHDNPGYTAFAGHRIVASGPLRETLTGVFAYAKGGREPVQVFEDETGQAVDFDLRGSLDEVLDRALPQPKRTGPGRPKLGVVSREVSLLPRHWEWLERQGPGVSAALRRVVDEARRREPDHARARRARDAAARFMWSIAGNMPGFEEASRALYAGDDKKLQGLVEAWPPDVRAHALRLARHARELEGPRPTR